MIDLDNNLVYDYRTSYTTVSVSNKPDYTSKINLLNTSLNIRCGYNTRNKQRWLEVTNQRNIPLLPQTFLNYGRICEFNFQAELMGLNYYVTLKPKELSKVFDDNYNYLNWKDDFDLYFVGRSMELEERMNTNGRKILVGN